MTHALIIGGGIAGPVTAVALQRAGITSTIYEAHVGAPGEVIGGWLTVAVNGLDALRCLDLHAEVLAVGVPSETIRFLSGAGKLLGELPLGGTLADGTVTHTLRRADLYAALQRQALARGVPLEVGKRLVEAEVTDGGVVARFADGTQARGDLLIGADGIHSRVRTIIDPAAPRPRYVGMGNMGGFTPAGAIDLAPGTYTMIFGKRCFFGVTVGTGGEVWWFANPPSKAPLERRELAETSAEQWRERIAALFDGDRSPAARIVRASRGAVIAANQYDMPTVPTWRRGPMVIVGDAAHAASPSSGQGASMAIEDAVELARCLRDAADVTAGLASYERLRRDRVERVVAYGARMGGTKTVGPVGRVLRDLMLPAILRRVASKYGPESVEWLFAHHIEWDARAA